MGYKESITTPWGVALFCMQIRACMNLIQNMIRVISRMTISSIKVK